jgi:Zn-dependent M28 family amino/carboxypeptidase
VVGAHYDSPDDSPGANDNGTGVAALIEIARAVRSTRPERTRLRLVFFVNEEQPYGQTEAMGSWRYARDLKDTGERVAGMLALETIGYFSDWPGSQRFPPPFGLIYPNKGNFIAFVALPGARSFLHRSVKAFRQSASFPSIGGVAPSFISGVDLSDHWSFHQLGYPALMVTDSAPFRNPYYHELDDLPENVDYESLARVTSGIIGMLRALVL